MATDCCTRCKGKGFRDTPVVHLGVPGLCYGCDGDGSRATQLVKKAKEAEAKKVNDAHTAAVALITGIAKENGGISLQLPRDKRRAFPFYTNFTTAEYAEKFGMTKKAAFIELCRSYPKVHPVIGDDLKPCAWVFG